jgi:hypothetical protein
MEFDDAEQIVTSLKITAVFAPVIYFAQTSSPWRSLKQPIVLCFSEGKSIGIGIEITSAQLTSLRLC